jgi:hypothetical protein
MLGCLVETDTKIREAELVQPLLQVRLRRSDFNIVARLETL